MSGDKQLKEVILIGYSGHAFVAADIFLCSGYTISGYCDNEKKGHDPFSLPYMGSEKEAAVIELLNKHGYFIAIGDNEIRKKIYDSLAGKTGKPLNAVHPSAVIAATASMKNGVFIAANATINPLVKIGVGVICNTSCSIDHECVIEDFAHIGPGTVLCGNVTVGAGSFIGANSVVKQGITIGKNVTIGAGAVIVKNVTDNSIIIGNPQKQLNK